MKGVIRTGAAPVFERKTGDRVNRRTRWGLFAALAACLLMSAPAYCKSTAGLAPITIHELAAGDSDSVFNWTEVPSDQEVTITRATFDEGGYQLYDTVGETIVVPFPNHNLYVMKFARSENGNMYFVNTGTAPVLYVPQGDYLVNADDPGAKWYPFSPRFHPATPVYVGIAPSWNAYVNMGWYPDMDYYGGYWCDEPYYDDPGLFIAIPGLSIFIGDVDYGGWWPYYHYCFYHRPPFRTAFWDRDVYRWAGRPAFGRSAFGQRAFGHPFGRPAMWAHRTFSGRTISARPFREFRGAPGGVRNAGWSSRRNAALFATHGGNRNRAWSAPHYGGGRNAGRFGGNRNFGGGRTAAAYRNPGHAGNAGGRQWAHRSFGGSNHFGGRQSFARRSYGGGNRFGGRPSFARRSFGGGGHFGGGSGQMWAHRSFGGGGVRSMGGGGQRFGGGRPGGGSNGGRPSGGGGGGGRSGGGGGDRRHDH